MSDSGRNAAPGPEGFDAELQACEEYIDTLGLSSEQRTTLKKKVGQLLARHDRRVRAHSPEGRVDPERLAQIIAHRACTNEEHDPENGKLSGFCVVCGYPWPCQYAGPSPEEPAPSTGAELIAAERKRQVEEEGWTPEHDDGHEDGDLLAAASEIVGYLDPTLIMDPDDHWGLIAKHSRKEGGDLRLLVIAGALIAAEIDRLQREGSGG